METMNIDNDDNVMMTVKMLTYNHEKYVARAIESIVAQKTQYKYELLIGDDGSTDGTVDIINYYRDRYPDIIRVMLHKKNIGITKNSYLIDVEARGKYIAGCDGDDYWCDECRVEKDVSFLESHTDYVGICHKCGLVDEFENKIMIDSVPERMQFWKFNKHEYKLKDFEEWSMPGHGSALTGRNLVRNEKNSRIVYEASDYVGDRTHVLILALNGTIYCDDDIVSCYRYRPRDGNNYVSMQTKKNLRFNEYMLLNNLERWASSEYGVNLDLRRIKADRFVGSVVYFMKNPSISNLKVTIKIIHNSNEKFRYFLGLFKVFLLKLYYWHIKGTDHLINI